MQPADAARYCRRTIADALARLKRLGLKRIKTALGFKVVQDWNPYELHPPGSRREGPLFERLRSECNSCAAKEPLFYSKSKESGTPPWGVPDGVYPCEEVA
jgi:hypothetical protein